MEKKCLLISKVHLDLYVGVCIFESPKLQCLWQKTLLEDRIVFLEEHESRLVSL
jgi:hypothetical protein